MFTALFTAIVYVQAIILGFCGSGNIRKSGFNPRSVHYFNNEVIGKRHTASTTHCKQSDRQTECFFFFFLASNAWLLRTTSHLPSGALDFRTVWGWTLDNLQRMWRNKWLNVERFFALLMFNLDFYVEKGAGAGVELCSFVQLKSISLFTSFKV